MPTFLVTAILSAAFVCSAQDLQITSASYGANNTFVDVASRLQSQLHDNALNVTVGAESMGGDPVPGVVKTVTVTYTFQGRQAQTSVSDGDLLHLPRQAGGVFGEILRGRGEPPARMRRGAQANLGIVSARYGAGAKTADVRQWVDSRVQNNTLSIRVANENLGGDPIMGQKKTLTIQYDWQGQRYEVSGGEDVTITIPNASDRVIGAAATMSRASGSLRITSASYGAKTTFRDVQAALQSQVVNDHLTIRVANDTMGGDPIMGQKKELRLAYEYGGHAYTATVAEDTTLSIPNTNPNGQTPAQAGSVFGGLFNAPNLQVIDAQYGANNKFNNVTGLLQSKIQADSLSMIVTNETMGGDPIKGPDKSLIVKYQYQGQTNTVSVKEGGTLRLPAR